MHQQSRHPPRVSSPASSPQTNPTRTNNPREAFSSSAAATRVRAGSDSRGGGSSAYDGSSTSEGTEWLGTGPSKDSIKKLDQVVQNLFYKTAILVVQSRLHLPPSNRKPNKWFQLETDELDVFRDELRVFRTSGTFDNRPPPMIIETYMDASRLSASQSLVVMDEYGKRWDVLEALNSSGSSSPGDNDRRNTEIILERWRIELKFIDNVDDLVEFQATLPTIYKRAVVFFRSLLVATRIMPCYKYAQQPFSKGKHAALELKCRILPAEPENPPSGFDPLRQPLIDGHSRDAVTDYMFGDLEVPVGRFYASVTYRNDCNFRVDDAESLLSSRFMGVDENFFKPSIGTQHRKYDYGEVGSLPSQRQSGYGQSQRAQEPLQTYGSLSTFHGEGALGTSPMTALKSVKAIGSDTSSPPSAAASIEVDPPHSLPIRPSTTRPSLRGVDGAHNRRPSVSFQPFKAGSLSGSPRLPESDVAGASGSPSSLTRPSGIANQARNRSSLTAGMAASLRTPGGVPTSTPAEGTSAGSSGTPIPVSASPRPVTSRYSSSFTHRRARPSFGTSVGQTKITPGITDDDQISSGKQSLSSSAAQPGSGLLTELGGNASSGGSFGPSIDDDNISEFLKALDSRKTLASFETSASGSTSGSKLDGSTAAKRTATQLYKFHLMRESNNALTESIQSMSSSLQLNRSAGGSAGSSKLGTAAGVTATTGTGGVSLSSSSGSGNLAGAASVTGTGKPLSPHTPHTPAIPSRLSENSIIDYQGDEQGRRGARRMSRLGKSTGTEEEVAEEEDEVEEEEDEDETPGPTQGDKERGARAIDIPLSPSGRIVHHGLVGVGGSTRRASSVAQKRNLAGKGVTRSNSSRGEELITNANADESDILLSEEMLAGGKRSISLGADDREAPSLSTLLAFQRQGTADTVIPVAQEEGQDNEDKDEEKDEAAGSAPRVFKNRRFTALKRPSQSGNDESSSGSASASTAVSGAGRNTGGAGSGEKQQRYGGNLLLGRALGAATAAAAAASGSGGSSSMQGPDDGGDDEPLLFAMSELERGPSRRSLEAARGGHGSGSATPGSGSREETSRRGSGDADSQREREGSGSGRFEPKGLSKRGWP